MNPLDKDMDLPASNTTPTSASDAERRIGRFIIREKIGRGGMGEVFLAWDPDNNRTVALKVLDIAGYADPDTVRRFERESQAALVLDHVNIARFYGTEQDEQGRPIIAMEYIAGRGLDLLLDQESEILFSQLVDYVIQTARGLENAYRRSIIHRDIKPGNLIVDPDNRLKIIDFGLAKSMWDNSNLTGSGLVVGTPRYISPEQGMGRNVDHRSDIYSLGATFYELVTRKTPFEGDTPLAIMMKHINAPLAPPYMINPRVPADISDIIMKMMAKDPGHRYQDYEPLIRDLESAKIHRLSKERRTPGKMSGMHTIILPENSITPDEERSSVSSYLTEGLVSVDVTDDGEEHHTSPAKLALLSLAGIAVLGFALIFLMKPVQTVDGEDSTLGHQIAGMVARAKENVVPALTPEEIARQDQDNINTTVARMDGVVSRLLQMREKDSGQQFQTISQLRASGVFTADQTRDAWGNDFFITDSAGGGTLVAPGRDGHERTSDDFRLSLDGREQFVPPPLQSQKSAN